MSISAAIQKMIYEALKGDTGVASFVGVRVFDRAPKDTAFPFISFGPSSFDVLADDCLIGRNETIQIDAWSDAKGGKRECKQIVDAIVEAVVGLSEEMEAGYTLDTRLFLAQVMDDPDGTTSHGIVQIEVIVDG